MPDGKTHYRLWKTFLIPSLILSPFLGYILAQQVKCKYGAILFTLLIAFGYFSGRWLDPDLDQISVTSAEGRLMREIPILGTFIVAFFFPYAKVMQIFGGHRSFATHVPFFSTAVRIAWLLAPLLFYAVYIKFPIPWIYLICFWIGLSVADAIHWAADGFPH